jgi:hypothetical protein
VAAVTKPADDEVVDLDEMLAARREARGEKRTVIIGGTKFEVPPKLPSVYVRESTRPVPNIDRMVESLFGEAADEFWALLPDFEDADAVLGEIGRKVYGIDPGESTPSAPPLNRAGRRSRATSSGSTR